MIKHILLIPAFFIVGQLQAQLVPTCPPGQNPAENCDEACVYCDINGYHGSTNGYQGTHTVACGCIYVDNDQWLAFVAGDTMADFTVTNMGCVNMNGLQLALYENCNSNPIQCDCGKQGGQGTPMHLDNVPLSPGTTYYLMIDGWSGDKCAFTITVNPPSAVKANPIGSSVGPIQGPDIICPGAIVTYSVPPVANAGSYTWSVPSGWKINGQNSPQHLYAVDGGNTVKIKVGNTSGSICVTAANSCYPDGPDTCKFVTVGNTPVNVLPKAYVCPETVPYMLPWGQAISSSGNYQKTLKSIYGCDSTVSQEVIIRAPIPTTLVEKSICTGDSISLCGVKYGQTGSYTHHCQSFTGCDSTVQLSLSVLAPKAKINGATLLTCSTPSLLLSAGASPAGTMYEWQNGSGQILGNGPQLSVSLPGVYRLFARMDSGTTQCIQSDSVLIDADLLAPTVSATGGILNCAQSSITLQANSNAAASEWNWSGPGAFSSSVAAPTVSFPGIYTLIVKNQQNGCTASASAEVLIDTIRPMVAASGSVLTCVDTFVQLHGEGLPAQVSYQWNGPNSFSASIPSPTVSFPGVYTLLVTNPTNHCSEQDTAVVFLNDIPPGASALVNGEISCSTPSISLLGSSATNGVLFFWTGPGNFSAASAQPLIDTAGNYMLTVIGPNGCSSTDSVLVSGNTFTPNIGVTGGTLSCNYPKLLLQGNSTTSNVNYSWTGPNGFVSTLPNPEVSDTGLYQLSVVAPNDCSSSAVALVLGDFAQPDLFAATDTLTCRDTIVQLIAGSATQGVLFQWNGPDGFLATSDTASTGKNGVYTLTATALNGCQSHLDVNVLKDIAAPGAVAQGDTLTCTVTALTLEGTTTISSVQWHWTGPDNFISDLQNPVVEEPGWYQLEVTSQLNGCTSIAQVLIAADTTPPIAAAISDTLTCAKDTISLLASSDVAASFSWNGPGGFTYSGDMPSVALLGVYTLIAKALVNGCTDTILVAVNQDIIPPIASAEGGVLDCLVGEIALSGSSNTPGSSFSWTGPGNFNATIPNPLVSNPGLYLLTVTGPNGCQATITAEVLQDIQAPQVVLSGGGTLNCEVDSLPLIASILTSGANGVWSGPGNFSSNNNSISPSIPGVYTFVATALNGCTATYEQEIYLDTLPPANAFAQGGKLDCAVQSLALHAGADTQVSFQWSGPQGFSSSQSDPLATIPGDYTVTMTNLSNACTVSATTTVMQDVSIPDISVQSDTLSCKLDMVTLNASSSVTSATFAWSGPNNFISTLEDPLISMPGLYLLTITGPNACTNEVQHTVIQDITLPDLMATGDTLSCSMSSGIINATSATPGVQYNWAGPGAFSAVGPTVSVSAFGPYSVIAVAPNGCNSTAQVQVVPDTVSPVLTATGGIITCASPVLTLSAFADQPVIWHWTGPDNFNSLQASPEVDQPGIYNLSGTASNGCVGITFAEVLEQTQAPQVGILPPDSLHCNVTQVMLEALVAAGTTLAFQWSTSNGNILSGANTPFAIATQVGKYTVEVTDLTNGCSSTAETIVLQGHAMPSGVELFRRPVSCYGQIEGAAQILSVVGGTAPFSYAIDSQSFNTVTFFDGIAPGEHQLRVKDANGCLYKQNFEILELEDLLLELGPDTTIQLGQSIELSLDGCINYPDRVAAIQVSPDELDFPTLLRPLHSFRYRVSIVDSNGCEVEDSRAIYVAKPRKVYIPNVFKPDSDNNNLLYVFAGLDVQEVKEFSIFDRWGGMIFQKKDILPNDPSNGWDGAWRESPMTPAVFVYYAEVLFIDGEVRVFKGDVSLVR